MAGENVASPSPQPPPPTPTPTPTPASSMLASAAGTPQNSQSLQQQASHQTIAAASSVSLPAQHMNLQTLHPQPTSAGQLHAVNLSQGQAFGQTAALNQMNFQQTQQQKQASGTRPQHAQYAQTQVNSSNMQAQATSPAIVQSPPGTHSIPRTSSAQRLMPAATMAGARASNLASQFGPGSLPTIPSSQQQLALAQRAAAQGQGAMPSQQRAVQPAQVTQNQQHSSMQSGPSSARPLYTTPYIHTQQIGGLARPGMGGQATGHPSMLSSSQLASLQPQFASPQMQGRQKQGQVQPSQFPTSATAAPQMPIAMMGIGGQIVRPSGSVTQQQPRLPQVQTRPSQQQQHQQAQLAQQQTSLTSPQKLQAPQMQRQPVSSVATGLQSSPQSGAGSGPQSNQSQQPWIQQKQMQHHILQQQAAQQKQAQAQHSLQQSQQAHLSQQTQQQQLLQQQQLGRVQASAVQRPPTPTGVQPGTPASGATTAPGGPMSQPSESGNRILGKRSIQELVAQVDPNERLDPEVEDILLEIADDFIESVTTFACKLAKHRKSNILEAKDVLLHLNRNWDINIPGFGGEEYRAYKRMSVSESHKQRLALIKKSMSNQPTGQESISGKASGGQPANGSVGPQAPMAA